MALTAIQQVRLEVADTDPSLSILSDEEYQYCLDKQNQSIRRAALDAARIILFKLSINATDETVDVLSVKGSQAAKAYKEALQLYLKDPNLNPVYTSATGYAGGISVSGYEANVATLDNKAVVTPLEQLNRDNSLSTSNPFVF